jgi:hypothetical protein
VYGDDPAERLIRAIEEACLDRLIPVGDRHFRRAVVEFVAQYYRERNQLSGFTLTTPARRETLGSRFGAGARLFLDIFLIDCGTSDRPRNAKR